jgi:transposase
VFEAMVQDLRVLLRWSVGRNDQPTAVIIDSATRQSSPESGHRAGYDGHKKRKGSKIHVAVDTLGDLLVLHVTPANASERKQIAALAEDIQAVTAQTVEVGFVDQGYSGKEVAADAADHGIRLEVIKLDEAKKGFVLQPRRWVVERSFAWLARFRRLAKDYERLPDVFASLHFFAFATLMLRRLLTIAGQSP